METETIRYIIHFDYNFLDDIDLILKNVKIKHRSYSSNVSYVIDCTKSEGINLLKLLYTITSGQIKIEDITPKIDDDMPVGTDKPIGSKEAIDEN